jgi:hypothetical protein
MHNSWFDVHAYINAAFVQMDLFVFLLHMLFLNSPDRVVSSSKEFKFSFIRRQAHRTYYMSQLDCMTEFHINKYNQK